MNYGNYPDLSSVKKILIVKLRHLGDVLLTSAMLSSLKKRLPEAEIDVYIYKEAEDILLGHPSVNNLILYDRKVKKLSLFKKLISEYKKLKTIKNNKYDLVINLTEGDRGAIVSKFSKAKYKIGPDPHNKGFTGKRKAYTHLIRHTGAPRHTVEKDLDAIRRIGIFPEEKDLFIHIPEEASNRVKDLLNKNGFHEKEYILIHPASRWRFKCWPYFKTLLNKLLEEEKKVVFIANDDPIEKEIVNNIIKDHKDNKNVLDLTGRLNIKELASLIDMSKVLVCLDSLALHIASALKARTIVIFGPTSEERWGPWNNPKAKILKANISCRPCCLDGCGGSKISDCLYQISCKQVLDELLIE